MLQTKALSALTKPVQGHAAPYLLLLNKLPHVKQLKQNTCVISWSLWVRNRQVLWGQTARLGSWLQPRQRLGLTCSLSRRGTCFRAFVAILKGL